MKRLKDSLMLGHTETSNCNFNGLAFSVANETALVWLCKPGLTWETRTCLRASEASRSSYSLSLLCDLFLWHDFVVLHFHFYIFDLPFTSQSQDHRRPFSSPVSLSFTILYSLHISFSTFPPFYPYFDPLQPTIVNVYSIIQRTSF